MNLRKNTTDPTSLLLGFLLLIMEALHNLVPHYWFLLQFFYQQLLPNIDCIAIKIINATAHSFNRKPFLNPRFKAKVLGSPDAFLFLCIPFLPTCNDPLELTILTFLLLLITPLLVSWSVVALECLNKALRQLMYCCLLAAGSGYTTIKKSLRWDESQTLPGMIMLLFFFLRKSSPRTGLFHFLIRIYIFNLF